MKILVCEDNLMMLHTISVSLSKAGHEVVKARDGREGIAILNEGGVELLITDINLPYTKGLELLRYVNKEMDSAVPVIIMSGINLQETIEHARELGALHYLTKPVDPEELLKRVREVQAQNQTRS